MEIELITSSEILDIRDGTHDSPKYVNDGYPLITSKNLKNGKICLEDVSYITQEDYININKRSKVDLGDILYSMIGSIGNYAIVTEVPSFAIKNVALFKFKDERLYNRYFYFLLNSPFVENQIKSQQKGGTQKFVTLKILRNLKIPLPPLDIQKKIGAILDEADKLRQLDKKLIEKYNALTQSLFLDMFGDTWTNPKGWDIKLVEELASNEKHSIKAGPFGSSLKKEFYVEKGYKVYGQEQVIKDDLSFGDYYIDEAKYQSLKNCRVKAGDVLISLVGTYGKISVVPEEYEEGIINPRLMKISPNQDLIRPDFLKMLLRCSGVLLQTKNKSRGGTMDIVNVGIMRKIKVPLPPLELQNQFAVRVQTIEAQKELAQQELDKANDLFNSLLQKAFKGELV